MSNDFYDNNLTLGTDRVQVTTLGACVQLPVLHILQYHRSTH